jgi:exosortase
MALQHMSGYNDGVTTQARSEGQGDAADPGGLPHAPVTTPDDFARTARRFLSQIPPELRRLWRDERHWLFVVIPLIAAMLGPFRWLNDVWADPNGPLSFQPFVPLGIAYLFWAQRANIQQRLRERDVLAPVGSRRRYGTILVAALGCVLLVLSYLTMLTTLAILGMLLAFAGVLLCVYGPVAFPAFVRPLLFSLTMVPVPGTLIASGTAFLQRGCAIAAGQVLRRVYPSTKVYGNFIVMDRYTAQVSGPCSGVGILLPVLVLTFLLALLRRMKPGVTALLLAAGFGISIVMNTVRIVFMGLLGAYNSNWAESLHDTNSWIFTALAFYLTFLVAGRIGPRVRRVRS